MIINHIMLINGGWFKKTDVKVIVLQPKPTKYKPTFYEDKYESMFDGGYEPSMFDEQHYEPSVEDFESISDKDEGEFLC